MAVACAWARACWHGWSSVASVARVTLFAGPSAQGLAPQLSMDGAIRLQPPVRRGDIDRLIEGVAEPGVALVCDGVFQAGPAVSHAELVRAIDRGWQLWGVSSIGAIRAHELRFEGMRGWGYVHAQFSRYEDFRDDELCLLHLPEAPYTALTEALVNVRHALETEGLRLGITHAAQRCLVDELSAGWFGDRTPERLRELMLGPARMVPAAADALLRWLERHRVKTMDLQSLLVERPWQGP